MPKPEWVQRCSQRLVVPVQAMAVSGSYDLKSNVPRELTPLCHWMGRRGGGAERERERETETETETERQREREAERGTGRQTDRQTGRQTDRQTVRSLIL